MANIISRGFGALQRIITRGFFSDTAPVITGGVLVTGIITNPAPVITIDPNGKYTSQVNAVIKTSSINSVVKKTSVNARINKARVK